MGLEIGKRVKFEGTWDFAVDGGATGVYPLVSIPANFRVEDMYYEIQTAITSGGTPAVTIGDGDDDDGYFADFQASMGATGIKGTSQDGKGALAWDDVNDAADTKVYAAADTIDFKVATAALTAGKLKLTVYGTRLK